MQKGFREPGEKPHRFYKTVDVSEVEGGFGVLLDGRKLRTPQGGQLVVPTRALAALIADEWARQGESIEMADMHATRLANTAVDSIPAARGATAQQVADYASSDLLLYFAEGPDSLVERQSQHWEPVLARAEQERQLTFVRAAGIVHQEQPPQTLDRVKEIALALDDFGLAGLAFGAALFGSAVLAISLQHGWISGEQAFELSRLDEAWQAETWGVDEEAAMRAERLRIEAAVVERWFQALRG